MLNKTFHIFLLLITMIVSGYGTNIHAQSYARESISTPSPFRQKSCCHVKHFRFRATMPQKGSSKIFDNNFHRRKWLEDTHDSPEVNVAAIYKIASLSFFEKRKYYTSKSYLRLIRKGARPLRGPPSVA